MDDVVGYGEEERRQPRRASRLKRAIPIWRSRLYRDRRQQAEAVRTHTPTPSGRRHDDAALLREKREIADRLFALCTAAHEEVDRRGGDTAASLDLISELSFIISCWDAETDGAGAAPERERLRECRDLLGAMLLASEVTRLAMTSDGARSNPATDPSG